MFLKETTVRSGGRSYVYVQFVQGYRDERGRAPAETAARHVYSVHEWWDGFAPGCICVSPAIEAGSSCTAEPRAAVSALDGETAVELVLEFDQAADREEWFPVLLAVEGGEHARVVVDGGDRGAEAMAERLAHGTAA